MTRILLALTLLFCVIGSGYGLKCWSTNGQSRAMRDTLVITDQTCATTAKSCFRKWWKVVKWGDIYYELGCSDTAAKAETMNAAGPSGYIGDYYCASDFCNSGNSFKSVAGVIIIALFFNFWKN